MGHGVYCSVENNPEEFFFWVLPGSSSNKFTSYQENNQENLTTQNFLVIFLVK